MPKSLKLLSIADLIEKHNRINPPKDEITTITNVHDSGQPMNPISIKICSADSCAASSLPTG